MTQAEIGTANSKDNPTGLKKSMERLVKPPNIL
jgi:hypothetical protein